MSIYDDIEDNIGSTVLIGYITIAIFYLIIGIGIGLVIGKIIWG